MHAIALGKKTGFLTLFYVTNFDKNLHKYIAVGHPGSLFIRGFENKEGGKIVAYPYKIPDFKKIYPNTNKG